MTRRSRSSSSTRPRLRDRPPLSTLDASISSCPPPDCPSPGTIDAMVRSIAGRGARVVAYRVSARLPRGVNHVVFGRVTYEARGRRRTTHVVTKVYGDGAGGRA